MKHNHLTSLHAHAYPIWWEGKLEQLDLQDLVATVNSNVRAEESSCCYSESPFSNSRYISDDVTGLSYGVSIVRCEDTSGKMKIELLTTKPNTSLENYNLKTCDQFGSDC